MCFFLRIFAQVIQNGRIRTWSTAVTAVLLAAWYLLSVVGLNVHADREHGRTYVVCSLSGGDCEAIHPEHHCHDHACAGHDCESAACRPDDPAHAEGECEAGEDCCSDDFEAVLSVGGTPDAPTVPATNNTVVAVLPTATLCPVLRRPNHILKAHAPPPGGGDLLKHICVLRA